MFRVGEKNPRRAAKDGKIWISRRDRGRQITQGNRLNERAGAGTCTAFSRGNEKVSVHGLEEGT